MKIPYVPRRAKIFIKDNDHMLIRHVKFKAGRTGSNITLRSTSDIQMVQAVQFLPTGIEQNLKTIPQKQSLFIFFITSEKLYFTQTLPLSGAASQCQTNQKA